MKKRSRTMEKPLNWLPVDSRLFLPFIGSRRVRGIARIFLGIEIVLSLLVVSGSVLLAILRLF